MAHFKEFLKFFFSFSKRGALHYLYSTPQAVYIPSDTPLCRRKGGGRGEMEPTDAIQSLTGVYLKVMSLQFYHRVSEHSVFGWQFRVPNLQVGKLLEI